MRKVLVTGADGFVGSHLIPKMRAAKEMGYEITILEKDGFRGKVHQQWDGIIHLAAISSVGEAERNPVLAVHTNVGLTMELLQMEFMWFVFASTVTPPENVYGKSKQMAEDLAYYTCRKKMAGLRVLQFANIYGDGANPEKLLCKAVDHVKNGTPFFLKDGALPAEMVSIDYAVGSLMVAMSDVYWKNDIQPPKRISERVIKNQDQLIEWANSVAHTNTQPA